MQYKVHICCNIYNIYAKYIHCIHICVYMCVYFIDPLLYVVYNTHILYIYGIKNIYVLYTIDRCPYSSKSSNHEWHYGQAWLSKNGLRRLTVIKLIWR